MSVVAMSITVIGGCIGPFAKKSSGGGGGGGGDDEEEVDTSNGTSTATSTSGGNGTSTSTNGNTGTDTDTAITPPVHGARDGYGCLQGVVMDGFTGQRMDISALTAPSGVFVMNHGTLIAAKTYDEEALKGEYYICDIPVEETYPVFAYIDGYLAFESTVFIASTRPVRVTGDQAVAQEVKIPDPIEIANIRLFPLANSAVKLRVRVVHNGAGVQDAVVDVEPQAAVGHFAFNGEFANSANARLVPIRLNTDADGYAEFPAEQLSLGANYTVGVVPPAGKGLEPADRASFIFGINGAAASPDDFTTSDLVIELANVDNVVRIVSCSKEYNDFNGAGQVTYIFNREVAVVNKNTMTATLTVASSAALGTDDPGNIDSEQVAVSIASNKLTLSPKWDGAARPKPPTAAKPETDADNEDRDAQITYHLNTVNIKVVGDLDDNNRPMSGIPMPAACKSGSDITTRFFQDIF
jgi:hypothetical protein